VSLGWLKLDGWLAFIGSTPAVAVLTVLASLGGCAFLRLSELS